MKHRVKLETEDGQRTAEIVFTGYDHPAQVSAVGRGVAAGLGMKAHDAETIPEPEVDNLNAMVPAWLQNESLRVVEEGKVDDESLRSLLRRHDH